MDGQMDLFASVAEAYAAAPDGLLDNATLYREATRRAGLSDVDRMRREPIGQAGAMRNTTERRIRWFQQTLKKLGVIERVDGERGVWRLAATAKRGLNAALAGVRLVAFSTELGVAVWGEARETLGDLDGLIALYVSSPPYPLRQPRAYGGVVDKAYVDWLCSVLEPVVARLMPGGSIVLNLSNDIFESGSPARSLYLERLVLALHDRLGLWLMDRTPWVNFSKPPGPTYWACVQAVQTAAAYEPIFWFTNDPHRVRANNRRVLEPHTPRHRRLMAAGGERREAAYGDGAYRLKPGDFGRETEGRLPRNVIERGHACADTRALREHAKRLGLPPHGAMQPSAIPEFWIRFLTEPGDLVVDGTAGSIRAGLVAERLNRRWFCVEWMLQHLRCAAEMFRGFSGFEAHPALAQVA
jgi:site-specific DNA-methyltransferase (cytosine-N4-specific)